MSWRVIVIGAGFAGVAAAWAAHRGGARVTCLAGKAGAAELGSGALDRLAWDSVERAWETLASPRTVRPIAEDVRTLFAELGGYALGADGAPAPLCATSAGILRSCVGHDDALLDVGALEGRTVLLPRAARAGWDADSLARVLNDAAHKPEGVRFEACDAAVLRLRDEERAADSELASRHDDEARLAWLAGELKKVAAQRTEPVAFLLGPWLGALAGRARALSERVGAPVGEVLSGTAGVSGLRFEARRAALLGAIDARIVAARAARVEPAGARWAVTTDGDPSRVDGDVVVLAIGGLVSGGIVFAPADHGAGHDGAVSLEPTFRLSVHVAGARVTDGHDSGVPSSLHGLVLDDTAWPTRAVDGALERVGVLAEGPDGRLDRGIFAAGDVLANRPRTAIEAVMSGLAAGAAAARNAPSTEDRSSKP